MTSIEQANIEIFDYGAVTYVTKAKIEYLINIYFKHLQKLIKDTE
jgi:citrate lyase gamma subunit